MSEKTILRIKKLEHGKHLELPSYATIHSSGIDLYAANAQPININPGKYELIPTGISIALPAGFEAQIRPRSGLAFKHGLTVLNSPGTIDADYRGEVKVLLINHGVKSFVVENKMKIAQMVIARYEAVEIITVQELDDTVRGQGGFGSTGL